MQEEINKIIEMAKKKYNFSSESHHYPVFLVIHDDGAEYLQEMDEDDFYGYDSCNGRVAGDKEWHYGGYKALIKLTKPFE